MTITAYLTNLWSRKKKWKNFFIAIMDIIDSLDLYLNFWNLKNFSCGLPHEQWQNTSGIHVQLHVTDNTNHRPKFLLLPLVIVYRRKAAFFSRQHFSTCFREFNSFIFLLTTSQFTDRKVSVIIRCNLLWQYC